MFDDDFVYGSIEGLEFKDGAAFSEWFEQNTSKKMRSSQFASELEYHDGRIAIDWRGVEWDKADWANGDYGLIGDYIEQLLKKLIRSGQSPHGVIVAAEKDSEFSAPYGWRCTFECRDKKLFVHFVELYWYEWIEKYGDDEGLIMSVVSGESLLSLTDAAIALEELKADLGRKISKMSILSDDFAKAVGIPNRNCLEWVMDQVASRAKAMKGSSCRCEKRWYCSDEGNRCPVLRLDDCYCGLADKSELFFTTLEKVKVIELAAGDFE